VKNSVSNGKRPVSNVNKRAKMFAVCAWMQIAVCAFRIFSRFRTAFDGQRSTQAWLQNLAPFQVFSNTSVIQDKILTIYINFGKFKIKRRQIL
jgi:hypothetical protein